MSFNILTNCNDKGSGLSFIQDCQDIKRTLPDLQGTLTYGYNLTLVVGP